ncbi:hypothetical protein [Alkalihalobacillus pseudalcaliphilus]|uniref:hypothetical protein n=1 Tax=Alkalihalobacillus pseudalcaliphilus TaxID=79884 RepID=UPI00069EE468|nr:hypothetical protein [Alkalihalobacillus pseudalcaliphilus]
MRRVYVILLIVLFCSSCVSQDEQSEQGMPAEKPDDFDFSLKYGMGLNMNELNTYENTYTKDLIEDGTATTELFLTEEEIAYIYEQFRQLGVKDLPHDRATGKYITCMEPHSTYVLKMTVAEEEFRLKWDTACETPAKIAWEKFVNNLESTIIFVKEEYQQLPEAKGGYE